MKKATITFVNVAFGYCAENIRHENNIQLKKPQSYRIIDVSDKVRGNEAYWISSESATIHEISSAMLVRHVEPLLRLGENLLYNDILT